MNQTTIYIILEQRFIHYESLVGNKVNSMYIPINGSCLLFAEYDQGGSLDVFAHSFLRQATSMSKFHGLKLNLSDSNSVWVKIIRTSTQCEHER